MVGPLDRLTVSRAAVVPAAGGLHPGPGAAPAADAAPRAVFAPSPPSAPPPAPSADVADDEGRPCAGRRRRAHPDAGSRLQHRPHREYGLPALQLRPARARQARRRYATRGPTAPAGRSPPWARSSPSSCRGSPADFSEDNLVNYSGYTSSDNYQSGGNYFMSLAYLLRSAGPKNEVADPYPSPELTRGAHQEVGAGRGAGPAEGPGGLERACEDRGHDPRGGGHVHAYWDDDVQCYDEGTFGYYYGGPVQVNHCVDVVGWDDDFRRPNSWRGGSPRATERG